MFGGRLSSSNEVIDYGLKFAILDIIASLTSKNLWKYCFKLNYFSWEYTCIVVLQTYRIWKDFDKYFMVTKIHWKLDFSSSNWTSKQGKNYQIASDSLNSFLMKCRWSNYIGNMYCNPYLLTRIATHMCHWVIDLSLCFTGFSADVSLSDRSVTFVFVTGFSADVSPSDRSVTFVLQVIVQMCHWMIDLSLCFTHFGADVSLIDRFVTFVLQVLV